MSRVVALRIIAGARRGGMNPQVLSGPDLTENRHLNYSFIYKKWGGAEYVTL
jgi:hypothetical protein